MGGLLTFRTVAVLALISLGGCGECEGEDCRPLSVTVDPPTVPELPPPPVDGPELHREVLPIGDPQVDILFVVDTSEATDEDLFWEEVYRLVPFWKSVATRELDVHLGVVDSGARAPIGQVHGWATSGRSDYHELFSTVRPGTDSESGYGRLAAYRAIEMLGSDLNRGFLRPDSELHLVFLAGQEDLSVVPDPREFTSWMTDPGRQPTMAHAIVPADATRYASYATETGGQALVLGADALDYDALLGDPLPPPLYLAERPADPSEMMLYLRGSDAFGTVLRKGRVCESQAADCLAFYDADSNSLQLTVRPDGLFDAVVDFVVD